MKKTIYLIRHGQTDYNKMGIVQGSGINSSLNEKGLTQANAFYQEYKDIKFDKVYTSELKRTQQSVANFIKDGIAHESLPSLNEINWGIVEGVKPSNPIASKFVETMDKWRDGILDIAVENGETPLEMQIRQRKGIEYLVQQTNESIVLIASHGRAMRSLLCTMLNIPLSRMDEFEHTNLCLYKLEYYDGNWEIVLKNDTTHLSQ